MGRRLQPWEVSMIRRLSIAYVVESASAQEYGARQPYVYELTAEDHKAIGEAMKAAMRSL